jgi:hypothetical protein
VKLQSYEMLDAMDSLNYRLAGEILGEYFGIKQISELAHTLRPMICWSSAITRCKYTVSFVHRGCSYHWYSSIGFASGAVEYDYAATAFDIILRQDAAVSWKQI